MQTPLEYGMGVNVSFLPSSSDYWQADVCNISQALLANAISGSLPRLSNEECSLSYGPGNGNMRGWSNLLALTKPAAAVSHPESTILLQFRYPEYVSNYTVNNWVCGPNFLIANNCKCNYRSMAANASPWNLGPINAKAENPFVLFPSEEWPLTTAWCKGQTSQENACCNAAWLS